MSYFGLFPSLDLNNTYLYNYPYFANMLSYKQSNNVSSYDIGDKTIYHIDIPGMTKDDIKITMCNNTINVEGTLNNYESTYKFSKSFSISNELDPNSDHSSVDNGVLKISFNKQNINNISSIRVLNIT